MNLWTPPLREISAKNAKKMGVVALRECQSCPHYWEACQLDKKLKTRDEHLAVEGHHSRDGFRWIVNWTNREGAVLLVRCIEDENENYAVPAISIFEDLARHDLWGESDWEKTKRHTEDERRQEREEKRMKEEELAGLAEKVEKLYTDAGWSQRAEGQDIKNFSFAHGTRRGRLPD
jgi:hypothetical protein